ncbi:unnamed protein product [Ophioblennius macclurei]
MSDTQIAMALLLGVFNKYAGKEGDSDTLTKTELKDLLQNELKELLGKAKDNSAVDKLFKDLDRDSDNKVDFKEFGTFILSLTVMFHDYLKTCK